MQNLIALMDPDAADAIILCEMRRCEWREALMAVIDLFGGCYDEETLMREAGFCLKSYMAKTI